MSVEVIKKFLVDFPRERVLILPHGQTLLRLQYYSVINSCLPLENIFLLKGTQNEQEDILDKKIVISLPQTLFYKKKGVIGEFGLVVVDEAHNFYLVEAGMVKNVLSQINPPRELLLTGSPSKFIAENKRLNKKEYEIITFPSSQLIQNNVIIDPKIILLKTEEYKFNIKDYFSRDEIRRRRIDTKLTKNVIIEVIRYLSMYDQKVSSTSLSKGRPFGIIRKMMIVAIDEQHALEIYEILREIGLSVLLSTYSSDQDSSKIDAFKTEENIQALVVVQRGILGFNFPELQCVVDISLSLNPDRIFQMINRVVRISKNKNKLFLKVMPEDLISIAEVSLSCASALCTKQVYENYSGNYKKLFVPIFTEKTSAERKMLKKTDVVQLPNITYIPSFSVMTKIYDENKTENVSGYSWTTFEETRQKLTNQIQYWTLEKCLSIALQYKRSTDWIQNHPCSYQAAVCHGWLSNCTAHMEKIKKKWTLEECKEIALQYKCSMNWIQNHSRSYGAASSKGWLKVCTAHMQKLNTEWTLEKCKEVAMQYQSSTDWRKNNNKSYQAARKNGWASKCITYMQQIQTSCTNHLGKAKNVWTLEKCKEVAMQYQSSTDWRKNNRLSYGAAIRNSWLKVCTAHMQKAKNLWTFEKCKNEALKYKKISDWRRSQNNSYQAARRRKWLEKCTLHMK
jgi:hypothetical protein